MNAFFLVGLTVLHCNVRFPQADRSIEALSHTECPAGDPDESCEQQSGEKADAQEQAHPSSGEQGWEQQPESDCGYGGEEQNEYGEEVDAEGSQDEEEGEEESEEEGEEEGELHTASEQAEMDELLDCTVRTLPLLQ